MVKGRIDLCGEVDSAAAQDGDEQVAKTAVRGPDRRA